MAASVGSNIWDSIADITEFAQEKGSDPLVWALQISSNLTSNGVDLPSPDLADFLVSYICWDHNIPVLWKFLEKALVLNIVPPLMVLALLSHRVIPCRHVRPVAYRLFMELLKRHAFSLKWQMNVQNFAKIMKSIDDILHLSQNFGLQVSDPGILVVEFIYSIVWQLLDASLDDEGLLELTPEKTSKWATKPQEMEIDGHGSYDENRTAHHEKLQSLNTEMAIEMIGLFLRDELTSRILQLAQQNLPSHWARFVQRLQLLGANSSAIRNSKTLNEEELMQLTLDSCIAMSQGTKKSSLQKFYSFMALGSLVSSAGLCHGTSPSSLWLPLDLALEDAMDGYQVNATSTIEIITGLTKTLQAINSTTWHDTFLGLWIAALRLVQRERDPIEGPIPRLDTRLSILLSIIPLVVTDLIDEEENAPVDELECGSTTLWKDKKATGKCRSDLVSCLQLLGDYQGLLNPPQLVLSAANQAAAKAMLFVSGINVGSSYLECINTNDMPINCSGNMRHLIVEACIARNLLDTSAYFWPGYVNGCMNQIPHSTAAQVLGWSSFFKGAPLTPVMTGSLVASPASSRA